MAKLIETVSHGAPPHSPRSQPSVGPSRSDRPTCSPTSTGPAPPTDPPRPSTAGSNTSAARPSASATSPTTSPDHCSRLADSGPTYTLVCDELVMRLEFLASVACY